MQLKIINGVVFIPLKKLEMLWLLKNPCINQSYRGEEELNAMRKTVGEKCTFCGSLENLEHCELFRRIHKLETEKSTNLEKKIENLEQKLDKIEMLLQNLTNKMNKS